MMLRSLLLALCVGISSDRGLNGMLRIEPRRAVCKRSDLYAVL